MGRPLKFCGVVPYALAPDTGRVLVLLGRERFGGDRGRWSAFGGGVDVKRGEGADTAAIAARECFEETMGILGDLDMLRAALGNPGVYRLEVPAGVHYLLPCAYMPDLPQAFLDLRERTREALRDRHAYHPSLEKDMVAWVPLEAITDRKDPTYHFRFSFSLDAGAIAGAIAASVSGRGREQPSCPAAMHPPCPPCERPRVTVPHWLRTWMGAPAAIPARHRTADSPRVYG